MESEAKESEVATAILQGVLAALAQALAEDTLPVFLLYFYSILLTQIALVQFNIINDYF
jgi:hypothetical protein